MIKHKKFNKNEEYYVLYVETTRDYVSFKVEKGKFLDQLRSPSALARGEVTKN